MTNTKKQIKNGEKTTTQQNKQKTELIFILDRSGSMGGLEEETIKGYNSVIKNQQKLGGELSVTTILFDNQYEKIFDGVSAKDAKLTRTAGIRPFIAVRISSQKDTYALHLFSA
jgi:hypothetical protein